MFLKLQPKCIIPIPQENIPCITPQATLILSTPPMIIDSKQISFHCFGCDSVWDSSSHGGYLMTLEAFWIRELEPTINTLLLVSRSTTKSVGKGIVKTLEINDIICSYSFIGSIHGEDTQEKRRKNASFKLFVRTYSSSRLV